MRPTLSGCAAPDPDHYRRTGETRFLCPCCEDASRAPAHLDYLGGGDYGCPQCGATGSADVDGLRLRVPAGDRP